MHSCWIDRDRITALRWRQLFHVNKSECCRHSELFSQPQKRSPISAPEIRLSRAKRWWCVITLKWRTTAGNSLSKDTERKSGQRRPERAWWNINMTNIRAESSLEAPSDHQQPTNDSNSQDASITKEPSSDIKCFWILKLDLGEGTTSWQGHGRQKRLKVNARAKEMNEKSTLKRENLWRACVRALPLEMIPHFLCPDATKEALWVLSRPQSFFYCSGDAAIQSREHEILKTPRPDSWGWTPVRSSHVCAPACVTVLLMWNTRCILDKGTEGMRPKEKAVKSRMKTSLDGLPGNV